MDGPAPSLGMSDTGLPLPQALAGPLSHTHSFHKVQNIYLKNLNTTKHPLRALGKQEFGPWGLRTGPGLQKALEDGRTPLGLSQLSGLSILFS